MKINSARVGSMNVLITTSFLRVESVIQESISSAMPFVDSVRWTKPTLAPNALEIHAHKRGAYRNRNHLEMFVRGPNRDDVNLQRLKYNERN